MCTPVRAAAAVLDSPQAEQDGRSDSTDAAVAEILAEPQAPPPPAELVPDAADNAAAVEPAAGALCSSGSGGAEAVEAGGAAKSLDVASPVEDLKTDGAATTAVAQPTEDFDLNQFPKAGMHSCRYAQVAKV